MGMKIEDLTVTFKNHVTAIDYANLEIPKGIFGLLGENGAGKTGLQRTHRVFPCKNKSVRTSPEKDKTVIRRHETAGRACPGTFK